MKESLSSSLGRVPRPYPYLAILEAVAEGNTALTRIANYAGIPASHASKYVRVLTLLGLLERVPVLFSRRGPITVADKVLRSYLLLTRAQHSLGEDAPRVREWYASTVPMGWEELAGTHAMTYLCRELGLTPSAAGKLIRKGAEIDWVVIDDDNRRVLTVEAKWSDLSEKDVTRIARRVRALTYTALPSRIRDYDVIVAVYARSAPKHVEGAKVITPEDMPWSNSCTTD